MQMLPTGHVAEILKHAELNKKHNGVYFGCCKFHKWLVKAMQILCWFVSLNSDGQRPQKVPSSTSPHILAPKLSDQHDPATANTFVSTKWNFS